MEKFYPVVGITENIDMTLKVLEVKMPQYFKDAFIEYHTNVGGYVQKKYQQGKKECVIRSHTAVKTEPYQ